MSKRRPGRKPGTMGKIAPDIKLLSNHLLATVVSDLYNDADKITPLEFAFRIMNDDERDMNTRLDAAKLLLPYFHQKMPVMVDMKQDAEIRVKTTVQTVEKLLNDTLSDSSKQVLDVVEAELLEDDSDIPLRYKTNDLVS